MNRRFAMMYGRKLLTWLLCIAMVFSMTSVPVFAADVPDENSTAIEEPVIEESGDLENLEVIEENEEDVVMELEGDELEGVLSELTPMNVKYKDGTFRGSAPADIVGKNGKIKNFGTVILDVTVEGGKISNIAVIKDTKEYGSRFWNKAKKLLDIIKNNNGTDGVDVVSGATGSSNGIINAVKDALKDKIINEPDPSENKFAAGDGTKESPFEISNEAQLRYFADSINKGESFKDKYIKLTSDISLSEAWTPAGSSSLPFSGHFNGQGFKISNMNIAIGTDDNELERIGFFAVLAEDASVEQLTFENVNIDANLNGAKRIYAGVLAGETRGRSNNIVVDRVNVVSGNFSLHVNNNWSYVGGLVGKWDAGGTLANSSTNINISSKSDSMSACAGGICAMGSWEALTMNCAAYGNVEVRGANMSSKVSCSVGGIMAAGGGMVYNCYFGGNLVLINAIEAEEPGIGGIFGSAYVNAAAKDCYYSKNSKFTENGKDLAETYAIGVSNVEERFTDLKAVDPDDNLALKMKKGLGSKAKETAAAYFDKLKDSRAKYNFNEKISLVPAFYNWAQDENSKLLPIGEVNDGSDIPDPSEPETPNAIFAGGKGTQEEPFLIETVAQLKAFGEDIAKGNDYTGKYIKLMADLDLSSVDDIRPLGMGVEKAGTFNGTFNGNNHQIKAFTQGTRESAVKNNDPIFVGLFVHLNKNAVVKNLGLTDICINVESKTQVMAGGIAAQNSGALIDSCYVTGYIRGRVESKRNCFTAGIVPYSTGGGIINSWTNVDVRAECTAGNAEAGGISALSMGIIANCYATGNVSGWTDRENGEEGVSWLGGIAGLQAGQMANCYATGNVESDTWTKIVGALAGDTTGISTSAYNYFNKEARVRNAATVQNPVEAFGIIVPGGINEDGVKFRGAIVKENEGYTAAEMKSEMIVNKLNSNFAHFPIDINSELSQGTALKKWKLDEGVATLSDQAAELTYEEIKYVPEEEIFENGDYYGRAEGTKGFIILKGVVAEGHITDISIVSHEESEGFENRAKALLEQAKAEQGSIAVEKSDSDEVKALKKAIISLIKKVRIADHSTYDKVDKSKIFAGGSGSAEDPYKISNAEQLQKFAASVTAADNYEGEYVVLTHNIDMKGLRWIPIGGTGYYSFCGNFDGKGHTVSNITMGSKSAPEALRVVGFFATLEGATVKNLNLKDVELHSYRSDEERMHIGGLAGQIIEARLPDKSIRISIVDNCSVTGSISGRTAGTYCQLGGIAGFIDTSYIMNCGTDVELSGSSQSGSVCIGGIAGINAWNALINNFAMGSIYADTGVESCSIGGISGMNAGVSVNNYADMKIASKRSTGDLGGVIGRNTGIAKAYNNYFNSEAEQKSGNKIIDKPEGVGYNVTSMGSGIVENIEGKTAAQLKTAEFAQLLNKNINDGELKSKYEEGLSAYAHGQVKLPEGYGFDTWVVGKKSVVLKKLAANFGGELSEDDISEEIKATVEVDVERMKNSDGEAIFNLKLKDAAKVASVEVHFEANSEKLKIEALNGFESLGLHDVETDSEGVTRGMFILTYTSSPNGTDKLYTDELSKPVAKILINGEIPKFKVTKMKISGSDSQNKVLFGKVNGVEDAHAAYDPEAAYSIYDLDRNGKVNLLDITIAQFNYHIKSTDPEWQKASGCDVNHDNIIDIQDLIDIMKHFDK